jgi:hypothetical protein
VVIIKIIVVKIKEYPRKRRERLDYELDFYILWRRNTFFKGLIKHRGRPAFLIFTVKIFMEL